MIISKKVSKLTKMNIVIRKERKMRLVTTFKVQLTDQQKNAMDIVQDFLHDLSQELEQGNNDDTDLYIFSKDAENGLSELEEFIV